MSGGCVFFQLLGFGVTGARFLQRLGGLTVTSRVVAGFGVFFVLILMLGLVAHGTLSGVRGELRRYFAASDTTQVAAILDPLFRDLDIAVREAVIRNRPDIQAQAAGLYEELGRAFAQGLENGPLEEADRNALEGARQRVTHYWTTAREAMRQRGELEQAINEVLYPVAEQLRLRLEPTMNAADAQIARIAGGAAVNVMLMRDYASRYLDRHRDADAERVRTELSLAKSRLLDVSRAQPTAALRTQMQEVDNLLAAYAIGFARAEKAIREGDRLSGEVLASVGPQVVTALTELRQRPIRRDMALRDRLETDASALTRALGWALAAGAVVAGLVVLFFIRTVGRPYQILANILTALAEGRFDAPIPVSERADEFGRMVRALSVYREHRRQVERQWAEVSQSQEEEAQRLRSEMARQRDKDAELREVKLKLRDEQQRLRDKEISLREEQERLTGEAERVRRESRRLDDEAARLAQENAHVQEEGVRLRAEAARLEKAPAQLQHIQTRLNSEAQRLQRHQERLHADLGRLHQYQAQLAREEARLSEAGQRLAVADAAMVAEQQQLSAERAAAVVAHREAAAQVAAVVQREQSLRAEERRLDDEARRLEALDEQVRLALGRLIAEGEQLATEEDRLHVEREKHRVWQAQHQAEEAHLLQEAARLAEETARLHLDGARLAQEAQRLSATLADMGAVGAEHIDNRQERAAFLTTLDRRLRPPVGAIVRYSQNVLNAIMHQKAWSLAPEVEIVGWAGEQLLSALDASLELARLEAGELALRPVSFDVLQLTAELHGLVAPVAELNGNELIIDCPHDIGLWCADYGRLQTALLGVLDHACTYTENGEVWIRAMRIDGDHRGDDSGATPLLRFIIADSGRTSPVEDILPESTPVVPGVGLSTAARLIALLGGSLSIATGASGTSVELTLPHAGQGSTTQSVAG